MVSLSLSKTIKMFPAVGWVKGDRAASEDLLAEINDLRKQNNILNKTLADLSDTPAPAIDDLAGLKKTIVAFGKYTATGLGIVTWRVEVTWIEIFGLVSPYVEQVADDDYVKTVLQSALFNRSQHNGHSANIDDQQFRTICIQLRALGLINTKRSATVGGGTNIFWSLTPSGDRLMIELRTVRSKNT